MVHSRHGREKLARRISRLHPPPSKTPTSSPNLSPHFHATTFRLTHHGNVVPPVQKDELILLQHNKEGVQHLRHFAHGKEEECVRRGTFVDGVGHGAQVGDKSAVGDCAQHAAGQVVAGINVEQHQAQIPQHQRGAELVGFAIAHEALDAKHDRQVENGRGCQHVEVAVQKLQALDGDAPVRILGLIAQAQLG